MSTARTRPADFGITEAILADFLAAGADCVTLGNHAFDQRESLTFIAHQPRLIRPLNYPRGTPGSGTALIETAKGERVLVINLMGRTFMDAIDDPFAAGEREIGACLLGEACDAIIVDFHAEASSEKQAFAHFIDGRVSLVVGTHTHVPTADYQILPQGTAFITDVGMTGDYDSIIGMEKEEPIRRFVQKVPGGRLEPAGGVATLCGIAVETDARGLAARIAPVRIGGRLRPARPDFWD